MAQYNLFENKSSADIDVDGYLKRINCQRERTPSIKYLRQLHRNHLYNIPFENLDIHTGKQIILDLKIIYQKLINKKRGGFCYELNGLFFQLLLQLGFYAKIVSARTYAENGEIGEEFDHLFLIVQFDDQEWLVDVGFGDLFLAPIQFKNNNIQMDGNKYFQIQETPDQKFILQSSLDGTSFKNEYIFSRKERQFVEFVDKCHYHQSSPKSIFTRKKVITQATKEGRITLTDKKFIIKKLGKRIEEDILNLDQFETKLAQHFLINLKLS